MNSTEQQDIEKCTELVKDALSQFGCELIAYPVIVSPGLLKAEARVVKKKVLTTATSLLQKPENGRG